MENSKQKKKLTIKQIILLVILALFLLFCLLNLYEVRVNFIFTKIYMSLGILLPLTFFLGALLVYLYHIFKVEFYKREVSQLKSELEKERQKVKSHRETLDMIS